MRKSLPQIGWIFSLILVLAFFQSHCAEAEYRQPNNVLQAALVPPPHIITEITPSLSRLHFGSKKDFLRRGFAILRAIDRLSQKEKELIGTFKQIKESIVLLRTSMDQISSSQSRWASASDRNWSMLTITEFAYFMANTVKEPEILDNLIRAERHRVEQEDRTIEALRFATRFLTAWIRQNQEGLSDEEYNQIQSNITWNQQTIRGILSISERAVLNKAFQPAIDEMIERRLLPRNSTYADIGNKIDRLFRQSDLPTTVHTPKPYRTSKR